MVEKRGFGLKSIETRQGETRRPMASQMEWKSRDEMRWDGMMQ